MSVEKIFIKESIKENELEKFLAKKFEKAGYSHTEIRATPLGTRIIVYAHKPGLVIGRSGRRIEEITKEIKEKFGFENPMIDVKEVENPFLDAHIVARRIARAIERGIHYKKVANYYLDKVMEAGAIGVQIKIGGKLAGVQRSRFQKFRRGFVAFSGEYARTCVDFAQTQAMIKPGIVGIEVRIMKKAPPELMVEKGVEKEFKSEKESEEKGEKEVESCAEA